MPWDLSPTAFAARCAGDGEFRIAARHWNVPQVGDTPKAVERHPVGVEKLSPPHVAVGAEATPVEGDPDDAARVARRRHATRDVRVVVLYGKEP